MANTYKLSLKNGEIVVFTSNMNEQEIDRLPQFANQHDFFSYFKEKGIILHGIVKPSLVNGDEKE
ncbi:hypothetical protein P5664_18885 [Bacillus subtilis]|nr:hypothetical protein P5626_03960 [Bacillus subtilis]WGD81542.1 hypothetical protein P5659_01235 [Bacillus subtilis]WGD83569.1 hypothetical protein P5664_18885 [Bacillus subtilis]WGD94199.1 hypothetical protein P5642_12230 [Bacillus subtilis]WGE02937.1 hypothetical protein P5651_21455 [Bacillus subtilis]